jgi:uncharacterized protein
MDKTTLAPFMSRRFLELIILPTEQCNFRCTYCYEDFEIGHMKENTVEAVKKLIMARLPGLSDFTISWFGGEPLMAKGTVYELTEFAKSACEQAGVRFRSVMTTNAFGMDRATFDRLTSLGVRRYQISLDGDEEQHNKTRKLMSGRGSFQKIWANLLEMRSNPDQFSILLRLHIHQENIESIRVLLGRIVDEFGGDSRFQIFMKAVGNWGGDSVKSMALMRDSSAIIREFEELLEARQWFANRGGNSTESQFSPCYAARSNSFVIRADGALAKCTVAFSDPRNRVGVINDDGTLTIENEKMRNFMRGFQTLDEEALHCPMKGMPKLEEFKVIKFERTAAPSAAAVPALAEALP